MKPPVFQVKALLFLYKKKKKKNRAQEMSREARQILSRQSFP